jgi:tetratricopeptide (TPR) repeat protein
MNGAEAIQRAYEAILKSDFEAAVEWFLEAVALEPDNPDYYYRLSITCARSDKLPAALNYAREALRLSAEPVYQLHLDYLLAKEKAVQAEACLKQGGSQLYLAVTLLKEAILLDPLSVEARLLLGYALGELEEYPQAIVALKEASRLNPQHERVRGLQAELEKRLSKTLRNK